MESNIEIRQFDRAADYGIVAGWWEALGQRPVEPCALSRDGFFCTVDGEEAACAWLYVCNSSDVARGCHLIGAPEFADRAMPVRERLVDFLRKISADIGKLFTLDEPFNDSRLALLGCADGEDFTERLQAGIRNLAEAELPLEHIFTPGLYTRRIFMPAGSVVESRVHKTEHPYIISKGDVSVWTKADGLVRLKAPHTGITRPGTHRFLFMHEDTIWTTMHPNPDNETDPDKLVEILTDLPARYLANTEPREVLS